AAQARAIARDAAARGRRRRQEADERERERRHAELASQREAAAHWQALLGEAASPPAPEPANQRLRAALSGPTQVISLQTLWEVARANRGE
ncbi:hypothetical protein K1W54_27090, partial [Micromonospora sp. CPCC 205371]|nr:hypothetical protein [Micromonospora sp. CPCC 205371]